MLCALLKLKLENYLIFSDNVRVKYSIQLYIPYSWENKKTIDCYRYSVLKTMYNAIWKY